MRKFWMIVIGFVVCSSFMTFHSAAEESKSQTKCLIPADKKLSQEWVRDLFERGTTETYRGKELDTIGMPIGGIATGQLYLRGDGTLGVWQIFNRHVFILTTHGHNCYRTYKPDSPVDSGFAVIVEKDGKTLAKLLNRNFSTVEFAGEYPVGIVRYREDGFPVKVELEVFSPFIPLNAKDSALPATIFHITVENTSGKSLRAGILAWLENAVCIHSAPAIHGVRRSRIVDERGRALVIHTVEKTPLLEGATKPRPKVVLADFEGKDYADWKVTGDAFGKGPAKGTLPEQQRVTGFLGKGLVNTFLGMDRPYGTLTSSPFNISRKLINFLIGGGILPGRTCINLLIDGKVVRTAAGKNNEKLEWHFWNVQEFEGKQAKIEIVDRASDGFGHINIDQIELSDTVGPIDKLPDYGSMVLALAERDTPLRETHRVLGLAGDTAGKLYADKDIAFPVTERRNAALCSQGVELAPGAKRTFIFVLAWFFPNYPNGRDYANRFNSAAEVAHYVLDNYERLVGDTRKWHETYYEDSTLPRWLLFRLHSTMCNLATGTCQWWKNGRFWGWEGVGSACPGTCGHLWNYEHGLARLLPELERSVREMQDFNPQAGFVADTGMIRFRGEGWRAWAGDSQAGYILKAYREHQISPNNNFLERNWPNIRKALEFLIKEDGNADGLLEGRQHNTYDINFYGANTMVGSLYLAALRACEEMAKEMGDEEFAERCREIFESGSGLTIERLWNGEYFIQQVDLKKHPKHQYAKGCLSDQLFGQGWAHQLGLGYIYPSKQVKKTLHSVWKYNWAPDVGPQNAVHKPWRCFARPGEAGLFTCTWPKGGRPKEPVQYKNEVWTGIEYQVAGHMVYEGMVTEALAICRGIHERYHPARHNPFNEVEAGDHYARAMASWGVYTALAGYEYHGPKGHLGFAPRLTPDNFRAAFTAAEGWGTFAQKRDGQIQSERIELRWGRLSLRSLAFAIPEDFRSVKVFVIVGARPIKIDYMLKNGRLDITLKKKLILTENQALTVIIHR